MAPTTDYGSAPLQLWLLGAFRSERNAHTLRLSTHKAECLLAFLVLHPEQHLRERLAGLFWVDVTDERARHSLRSALTAIRQALGDKVILTDRETARLDPGYPLWVDVREFERVADSRAWRSDETQSSTLSHLQTVADLYRGDLLSEFDDDWIVPERERLRALYLGALLRGVQQLRREAQYAQAIDWGHKVLQIEPVNEQAHQHLIFCYAAQGERGTALKQYQECRRVLRAELNAEPSAQTTALAERIKQELSGGKAPEAVLTNLPVPLTSFVGRQQELGELKALLRSARLLTLTGAGGSGKTRLAIEVATELVREFRFLNGAWWVDLSSLTDPARLPQTVASVFGLQESQGVPLETALSHFLRAKELLLVLDNCEQLIAACARFSGALLSTCPNLRILATSREALGITGEAAWRVPTLAVPDTRYLPPLEQLAHYDAVQLFADRALAVTSNWKLAENTAAVVQICARLDGIPLAIELAAARLKALSAPQIAERLADRFQLLSGGSRTALPRQQTLRATMDWSHDLLTEKERCLFRRLAVFAGGWTLEAAELVCSGQGLEFYEVLDLLEQMQSKSLVNVAHGGGGARYHMLETIRQYAHEKLLGSGEEAFVRSRQLDFYLRWAEQGEPLFGGAQQIAWLNRLELEHDNLRAALGWSLGAQERVELGLRLAGALFYLWVAHDHQWEAWAWLEQLLNRSRNSPTAARAKALSRAGFILMQVGDLAIGCTLAEESLTVYRALNEPIGLAEALRNLGDIVLKQADDAQARALFEESLTVAREVGDQVSVLWALFALGHLAFAQGDYPRARSFYEECLAIARARGMQWGVTSISVDLGDLAYRQHDYATAEALYAESLAGNREVDRADHPWESARLLCLLGRVVLYQGNLERAASFLSESLSLFRNMEDRDGIGRGLETYAVLLAEQGRAERAGRLFGAVEALFESVDASVRIDALEPERYDRAIEAVRAQLGRLTFAAAWAEGRALTMEQAIALALEKSA